MIKISDIINYLDSIEVEYTFKGNKYTEINGFSPLSDYKCGTVTWIKDENSISLGIDPHLITLAFVQADIEIDINNKITTKDSKRAFFLTLEYFFRTEADRPAVGRGTYISQYVKLGKNVTIGYNCVLDGDITIGDNSQIWDNVSIINKVAIGQDCNIQSGVRIGHDGFGYHEGEDHNKTMIHHFGGVIIGNSVYIGPNSVIDRGTIEDTLIGDGVKIDALCFIAHNVSIGNNSTLIAGSKPYGSVKIGNNAYIASSIIRNQCRIGDNVVIGMGSVVTKDIEDDIIVIGNPAKQLIK